MIKPLLILGLAIMSSYLLMAVTNFRKKRDKDPLNKFKQ
jgi:hypothetical protein